uniref:Uncharacterized protein n=1 Tax=Oryza sativa subsp. japonica TaxID=39947 RepID=Q6ZGJ2_ORYSJ|nr:hypothetical protein [Oryza sativa Japonica Group]BAD16940.1 hypothetical protein [Oryza sativa Japonica Group]
MPELAGAPAISWNPIDRQGGDSGVPATATTGGGGGGVPATENEARQQRAGDSDKRRQRRLGFKAHWRRGVVEMKML